MSTKRERARMAVKGILVMMLEQIGHDYGISEAMSDDPETWDLDEDVDMILAALKHILAEPEMAEPHISEGCSFTIEVQMTGNAVTAVRAANAPHWIKGHVTDG